jgi:bacteriocin-associated integral membrane protein
MKKALPFLLIAVTILQIYISSVEVSNNNIESFSAREKQYLVAINIPDVAPINSPENLTEIFDDVMAEHPFNIYRDQVSGDNEGEFLMKKYALLSGESKDLKSFHIDSGKMLSEEESQTEEKKIASNRPEAFSGFDSVGTIDLYTNRIAFAIMPMGLSYHSMRAAGTYYIEPADPTEETEILTALTERINLASGRQYSTDELRAADAKTVLPMPDPIINKLLAALLAMLLVAFFLYVVFRQSKKTAIQILSGYTNRKIVFSGMLRIVAVYAATLAVSCIVLVQLTNNRTILFPAVRVNLIWFAIIFAMMIGIKWLIVRGCSVRNEINGKGGFGGIVGVNYFVTFLSLCTIFFMLFGAANGLEANMKEKQLSSDAWAPSEGYGIFYPKSTGNESIEQDEKINGKIIGTDLYEFANSKGALFVNAKNFESEFLKFNKDHIDPFDPVVVNPNYLDVIKIKDAAGGIVRIEESETENIILVPERHREKEAEIREYFEDDKEGSRDFDKGTFVDDYQEIANNKVKIVWIADGQDVFSFNPDVYAENRNMIEAPIIRVITLSNSYICEREGILGGGRTDPLKIKLDGNSEKTMKNFKGLLKEVGMDDNLKRLVSIDEDILAKIAANNEAIALSLRNMALALILYILVLFQNVAVAFDRNKMKIILKKMYGYTVFQRYRKLVSINAVLLICAGLILRPLIAASIISTILLLSGMLVLQCICTVLLINHIERKKIVDILKGE